LSDEESEDEVIGVETGPELDSEEEERKKRKKSTNKEVRVRKVQFEDERKKGKKGAGKDRRTHQEAPTVKCERQCMCSHLCTIIHPSP